MSTFHRPFYVRAKVAVPGDEPKARKFKNKIVYWCEKCDQPVNLKPCPSCGHADTLIKFDSKRERSVYAGYRVQEAQGLITGLRRQVSYPIIINTIKVGSYVADIVFTQDGEQVVVDVKGLFTPLSKFKIKCVQALYGLKVHIVK